MYPIEIVDSEHASGPQRLVVELANELRPGEVDEGSAEHTPTADAGGESSMTSISRDTSVNEGCSRTSLVVTS